MTYPLYYQTQILQVNEGIPWVPETFLARFPVSASLYPRLWLRPTAEDISAFGQHRKFSPHARKTSGTQGNEGTNGGKISGWQQTENPGMLVGNLEWNP